MEKYKKIIKILSIIFAVICLGPFVYYLAGAIRCFIDGDSWAVFGGQIALVFCLIILMVFVSFVVLLLGVGRWLTSLSIKKETRLGTGNLVASAVLNVDLWLFITSAFSFRAGMMGEVFLALWFVCLVVCIVLLIVYKIKTKTPKAVAEMEKLKED
ncbi:MAG: hypothetical protein IKL33_02660 [Alphaproteobacteria bacterium]|nr:hypothetical protein [Alphaproteobacteria bacterium]